MIMTDDPAEAVQIVIEAQKAQQRTDSTRKEVV
jgi:hypothetical protein